MLFRFDVEARLVAHPGAAPRISEALASTRTAAAAGVPSSSLHSRRVALAVGPEGGWTDFERALLVARLDNLGKGAAGQTLQNLNLMAGRPEDEGLR